MKVLALLVVGILLIGGISCAGEVKKEEPKKEEMTVAQPAIPEQQQKTIAQMSVPELKIAAYDLMAEIQYKQQLLQLLNNRIAELSQKEKGK